MGDNMNFYILRLKNGNTRVDRVKASTLEDAKLFFMGRKLMNKKQFDKLYTVSEDK